VEAVVRVAPDCSCWDCSAPAAYAYARTITDSA